MLLAALSEPGRAASSSSGTGDHAEALGKYSTSQRIFLLESQTSREAARETRKYSSAMQCASAPNSLPHDVTIRNILIKAGQNDICTRHYQPPNIFASFSSKRLKEKAFNFETH